MENEITSQILHELALATTNYHDAPPELVETARREYEAVLQRFRLATGQETVRVMTAGSSQITEY